MKTWLSGMLILLLMLTGCQKEGNMDKKEIETRAENVAVEYLKVNEDVDFVVDKVEFLDTTATNTVVVHGHEKGKKDKQLGVHIDYANDFTVDMTVEGKADK